MEHSHIGSTVYELYTSLGIVKCYIPRPWWKYMFSIIAAWYDPPVFTGRINDGAIMARINVLLLLTADNFSPYGFIP